MHCAEVVSGPGIDEERSDRHGAGKRVASAAVLAYVTGVWLQVPVAKGMRQRESRGHQNGTRGVRASVCSNES